MSFIDILRAEYKLTYSELFRRKSALISIIIYPYLFTGFILFFGLTLGSIEVFNSRIGADPIIYMITASYLMISLFAVIDDILWRPISSEYDGTLPYVIVSPVNKLKYYFAIPFPRLTVIVLTGLTSIVPVYFYYNGLNGLISSLFILILTLIGSISMITIAVIIMSIVGLIGESWRVLNIVRPILMILLGVYYPRILMPTLIYIASSLIPASYIIEIIQKTLSKTPVEIYLLLAIAIAITLFYSPISYKSIYFWEKRKVKKGV